MVNSARHATKQPALPDEAAPDGIRPHHSYKSGLPGKIHLGPRYPTGAFDRQGTSESSLRIVERPQQSPEAVPRLPGSQYKGGDSTVTPLEDSYDLSDSKEGGVHSLPVDWSTHPYPQRLDPYNKSIPCADNKSIPCADIDTILSFDTIRLFLADAPHLDTRQLTPFSVTRNCHSGEATLRFTYRHMNIKQNAGGVIVEGSLPKFLSGENLTPFSLDRGQEVLQVLSDTIGIDLLRASVTRLDVAATFKMENPPIDYFSLLASLRGYQRSIVKSSLYFRCGSNTLLIYDKTQELKHNRRKIDPVVWPRISPMMGQHWLRYELQDHNVSNLFNGGLTASRLFSRPTVVRLAEHWYNSYTRIAKDTTSLCPILQGNTTRSVKNELAALGIQHCGGLDKVQEMLSDAQRQARLSLHQVNRLRHQLKSMLVQGTDERKTARLQELNQKIAAAHDRALERAENLN